MTNIKNTKKIPFEKKSISRNKQIVRIASLLTLICIILYFFIIKKNTIKYDTPNNIKIINPYEFKKEGELTFSTSDNKLIKFINIEIANTEEKRMQGLMFREKMQENEGMLFIFDGEDVHSFWMKNTILPLDIIFINSRKEIVTIHKNATPYSEQSLSSFKPVLYVVEVNSGFTDKYNIKAGDIVNWLANK
jgi:uncharacterized protein